MRMRVKTFGSSAARSASSSTMQSVTAWRDLRRMCTTSIAVHEPAPMRTSSIGRAPRSRPPTSGAASTTTAWPLPLSATSVIPSASLILAFICGSVEVASSIGRGGGFLGARAEPDLEHAPAHGEQRRPDKEPDEAEGDRAAEYAQHNHEHREASRAAHEDRLHEVVDRADHADSVDHHEDRPCRFAVHVEPHGGPAPHRD